MQDEFELNVEDESEIPVAEGIMKIRKQIFEDNNFAGVDDVKARWTARGGKVDAKVNVVTKTIGEDGHEIQDDDSEDDEDDDDDDGDDGDVDMDDAPALVPKSKPEPEVDEDGFTKVAGKKRR